MFVDLINSSCKTVTSLSSLRWTILHVKAYCVIIVQIYKLFQLHLLPMKWISFLVFVWKQSRQKFYKFLWITTCVWHQLLFYFRYKRWIEWFFYMKKFELSLPGLFSARQCYVVNYQTFTSVVELVKTQVIN